jgi:lysophospholipase L1-like esterase
MLGNAARAGVAAFTPERHPTMSIKSTTTARRLSIAAAALALAGAITASPPATASESHPGIPVRPGTNYLALGDSVPFGYREPTSVPTPDYTQPDTFVGYPEDVSADLSLHDTNAACPGETTVSFLSGTAPSNGCEGTAGSPGYRDVFPLHVAYSGSQLDFAVQFLQSHPRTRLVSLMIGANDGFLCQKQTADQCTSEFPALLQTIGANVATILSRIRGDGDYPGQIVVVNYYSLDYADLVQTGLSQALNQAIDSAATPFGVEIADGFGAFQQIAAQDGGDTCAAGLLTVLSGGGCGIHPSAAGQAVLAGAVEAVVRTVH